MMNPVQFILVFILLTYAVVLLGLGINGISEYLKVQDWYKQHYKGW